MTVTAVRGGLDESSHRVHVAVARADGGLVAWHGDPGRLTTMRSSAKPFQAQPLVASGALEAFGFDDQTLAVCCASHEGADEHAAAVRRGLDGLRAGAGGAAKQRPARPSSGCGTTARATIWRSWRCRCTEGWDVPGYRDPDAPGPAGGAGRDRARRRGGRARRGHLHRRLRGGLLRAAAGHHRRHVRAAAAAAASPVSRPCARTPAWLPAPATSTPSCRRRCRARVAKGGAEGLGCVALAEQGLGIALRVEDGQLPGGGAGR